jgi:hypothetical protein
VEESVLLDAFTADNDTAELGPTDWLAVQAFAAI